MTDSSSERVTGAILFTDLVGFTEFNDAVGDTRALEVLDRQSAIAASVLESTDAGRVVKELGDGLMIWFDDAEPALVGALALLAAVDRARQTAGFPLAVRMGLHHGEALTRGDDLVGQTINIGARVAALAGPGELLLSEDVVYACAPDCEVPNVRAVGPVSVKGVEAPIWLHRVVSTA